MAVPVAMVRAYLTMLPRLQAEEAVAAAEAAALGAGLLKPADRRRILARLERQAAGGASSPAAPADPAILAAIGIAVVAAPRARDINDG